MLDFLYHHLFRPIKGTLIETCTISTLWKISLLILSTLWISAAKTHLFWRRIAADQEQARKRPVCGESNPSPGLPTTCLPSWAQAQGTCPLSARSSPALLTQPESTFPVAQPSTVGTPRNWQSTLSSSPFSPARLENKKTTGAWKEGGTWEAPCRKLKSSPTLLVNLLPSMPCYVLLLVRWQM